MSDRQPFTVHDLNRLTQSMAELFDQVEVLQDVLKEIRPDLQWAVQNDRWVKLPILRVEHTTIKRLAADPMSAEWGSRLETQVLRMPTKDDVQQVTAAVLSIIDEVMTATTGLSWVGDQVREQTDRLEETILATDDVSNQTESPQQEAECDFNVAGQPASTVRSQEQPPSIVKPSTEDRAGQSLDATPTRPPGRLF